MTAQNGAHANRGADVAAITVIADVLQSKFGDDALPVARLQRDRAADHARPRWEEIVARLETP